MKYTLHVSGINTISIVLKVEGTFLCALRVSYHIQFCNFIFF